MSQSSLLTWLRKPDTVKSPPTLQDTISQAPSLSLAQKHHESQALSPETDAALSTVELPLITSLDRSSRLPDLPNNVRFRSCVAEDIPHLRRLTSLLLPIPYPDSFFREIIQDQITNTITLLAFWLDNCGENGTSSSGERLVGAIRCRLLSGLPSNVKSIKEGPILYLSTLALLAPYRQHGIATHLLDRVMRRAVQDYGVTSVGAHVWEANEQGLEWYRKRGFDKVGFEEAYYRRLQPAGAVVMQKQIGALDLL